VRRSGAEAEAPRQPGPDTWGAVFCGGASLRMGRDKARLELDGQSLLEHSVRVLRELTPRVFLSCGTRDRYSELGLERVLDSTRGEGPLAGLAASLEHVHAHGGSWLLVLACDMPRADARVFRRLLERAGERGADACLLAAEENRPEPLFAVYHVRCLAAARAALGRGQRRMNAFHGEVAVETLTLAELAPPAEFARCAANVNSPQEFLAQGGELT